MVRTNAGVLLAVVTAAGLLAQSGGRPLSFEVASVRPNKSTTRPGLQFLPGGRFTATNLPLFVLIATAYDVPFQSVRLSGGPDWTRSERYDLEAAAPAGAVPAGSSTKAREDKTRSMLQTLLAERFKLTIRRETKDLPVYAVVAGKTEPKLQKAKIEEKDCPDGPVNIGVSCHTIMGGMGRGLHGKAVSVSDIVMYTENWSDRPMVDKTGIQGLFEVETDGWAPLRPRPLPPGAEPSAEDIAMADPTRPSLFLIFERLGLKLESQKAPVETFVIDHVEKPSEN
jgi:uncharacterized protein (TIGR03435 family)